MSSLWGTKMGRCRKIFSMLQSAGLHWMFRSKNIFERRVSLHSAHEPLFCHYSSVQHTVGILGTGQILPWPNWYSCWKIIDSWGPWNMVGSRYFPAHHWTLKSWRRIKLDTIDIRRWYLSMCIHQHHNSWFVDSFLLT